MSTKSFIYFGMIVGTTIGGLIPSLWGASLFSLWGVFLSAAGGILGIYIAFKLGD